MLAFLKFEWLLSGRLHLPSLLLPLLALSVTFSSKPVYPDMLVHQAISSAFIVCSMVVFYRACRHKLLAVGIPLAMVFLRIARIGVGDANQAAEVIYFIPYIILMLGVGAKMLRDYPLLLLRQMVWICAISIVLSLLQIMGVQWAQRLAAIYVESGGAAGGAEHYLLTSWSELTSESSLQLRPVGFAQANNVGSQYLLLFYAFTISWFAENRQRFRPPILWLFIVSFACALTGAKVVVGGIVLGNIAALMFFPQKLRIVRIVLVTGFAHFCYWLLFPGVFIYNFNIDLFAFNAMLRLADLLGHDDIPYLKDVFVFLSRYQTGDYIGQRSVAGTLDMLTDSVSGIGSVIYYLPFIVSTAVLLAPFWISRLLKLARTPYVNTRKMPIVMLVVAVASAAGGPFLFTSYFWFFFSFALYPLSVLLLRKPRAAAGGLPSSASLSPSQA